jgi:two-component system NtrC family sensor kinase
MQKQMAQADKLASIGELSSGNRPRDQQSAGYHSGLHPIAAAQRSASIGPFNDLKTIEKHVQSCKAIVEDLLNFARTSSPRKENLDIHSRD